VSRLQPVGQLTGGSGRLDLVRGKAAVIAGVYLQTEAQLAEVAAAAGVEALLFGARKGGQEQGGQDGNDRNDH
jgi:hypothetical protein